MLELLGLLLIVFIAFKFAGTLIGAIFKFLLFIIGFLLIFPIALWVFSKLFAIAAAFWFILLG